MEAATGWNERRRTYLMAKADTDEEVESDEEIMLLGTALSDANGAPLDEPAPTWEAVITKLQVFRDEETYCLVDERVREVIGTLIADVQRLSAAERA